MNDMPRPDLFDTMDVRRAAEHKPWWRRRLTWALAGAIALTVLAVWAWRLSTPGVAQVARSEVWLGTVMRGPFVVQVQAAGKLVPAESRWVAAPASGIVEVKYVEPGQTVALGAPLLKLSNPQVANAAQGALADYAAAQANRLAQQQTQDSAVLAQRSSIEAMKVKVESAAMHLKADATLAAQGIVSKFTYEDEKLEFQLEQQQLAFERERLTRLQSGNAALLAAEREHVRQLKALADLKQQELAQLTVRAPVAGQVEQLDAETGQEVAQGKNLARVTNPAALMAQVQVSQYDAASVQPGLPVLIDPRQDKIPGRVLRVDPKVKDGLVTVDVRLLRQPADGRVDQSVDAAIRIAELPDALSVPRPANVHANSTAAVFVLAPGASRALRQSVHFGLGSVDRIQVLSGLAPGEQLILSDTSAYAGDHAIELH
ncbi:HlyD family efflux transporter periplasmic adaptor subunit [Metallibacterium sp.]|uniref:efflux RND transporter periplasmic adaptor subunit n=1 Tax=Metallibacterium sp. TaxID=2940281 RepID=UPI002630C833|nr:HlyD family efflux transporter periplasmic adaptor subunit [Metallibacterium sp.]